MRFLLQFCLLLDLLCAGSFAADARPTLELRHDQLLLAISGAEKLSLNSKALSSELGTAGTPQRVALKRPATAQLVNFVLPGPNHAARSLTVLLAPSGGTWTVQREWTVDKCEDDSGSKDETQSFTCDANGTLTRRVHRLNVDNVSYVLPCKCCTAVQTKTMETEEEESYVWNETTNTLERRTYRKWYVTQYGEGLLNVARKALGDPTRLSRLYALNPELKQAATLTEGQKVLVEKM